MFVFNKQYDHLRLLLSRVSHHNKLFYKNHFLFLGSFFLTKLSKSDVNSALVIGAAWCSLFWNLMKICFLCLSAHHDKSIVANFDFNFSSAIFGVENKKSLSRTKSPTVDIRAFDNLFLVIGMSSYRAGCFVPIHQALVEIWPGSSRIGE